MVKSTESSYEAKDLLKRFNNAREPFGPHSVDRLEDLLGLSADGANPPVGQLLERGAGSDAVIRH